MNEQDFINEMARAEEQEVFIRMLGFCEENWITFTSRCGECAISEETVERVFDSFRRSQ